MKEWLFAPQTPKNIKRIQIEIWRAQEKGGGGVNGKEVNNFLLFSGPQPNCPQHALQKTENPAATALQCTRSMHSSMPRPCLVVLAGNNERFPLISPRLSPSCMALSHRQWPTVRPDSPRHCVHTQASSMMTSWITHIFCINTCMYLHYAILCNHKAAYLRFVKHENVASITDECHCNLEQKTILITMDTIYDFTDIFKRII